MFVVFSRLRASWFGFCVFSMAAAPVFLALPAGVKIPAGVTKPQVAVVQAALATAVAEAAAGKLGLKGPFGRGS